jgi:uncharacterized protein DUF5993
MTILIFLIITLAMGLAWGGQRSGSVAAFAIALLLAVLWFGHHVTDPLQLGL